MGRVLIAATAGFIVVGEADSGEAAIGRAAELRPDLILKDIRMKALDGIAATTSILERQPDVAVVLVSADDVEAGAWGGCGAIAFVRKQQLSPALLRKSWAAWCSGARSS